jgi:hypothetical protein
VDDDDTDTVDGSNDLVDFKDIASEFLSQEFTGVEQKLIRLIVNDDDLDKSFINAMRFARLVYEASTGAIDYFKHNKDYFKTFQNSIQMLGPIAIRLMAYINAKRLLQDKSHKFEYYNRLRLSVEFRENLHILVMNGQLDEGLQFPEDSKDKFVREFKDLIATCAICIGKKEPSVLDIVTFGQSSLMWRVLSSTFLAGGVASVRTLFLLELIKKKGKEYFVSNTNSKLFEILDNNTIWNANVVSNLIGETIWITCVLLVLSVPMMEQKVKYFTMTPLTACLYIQWGLVYAVIVPSISINTTEAYQKILELVISFMTTLLLKLITRGLSDHKSMFILILFTILFQLFDIVPFTNAEITEIDKFYNGLYIMSIGDPVTRNGMIESFYADDKIKKFIRENSTELCEYVHYFMKPSYQYCENNNILYDFPFVSSSSIIQPFSNNVVGNEYHKFCMDFIGYDPFKPKLGNLGKFLIGSLIFILYEQVFFAGSGTEFKDDVKKFRPSKVITDAAMNDFDAERFLTLSENKYDQIMAKLRLILPLTVWTYGRRELSNKISTGILDNASITELLQLKIGDDFVFDTELNEAQISKFAKQKNKTISFDDDPGNYQERKENVKNIFNVNMNSLVTTQSTPSPPRVGNYADLLAYNPTKVQNIMRFNYTCTETNNVILLLANQYGQIDPSILKKYTDIAMKEGKIETGKAECVAFLEIIDKTYDLPTIPDPKIGDIYNAYIDQAHAHLKITFEEIIKMIDDYIWLIKAGVGISAVGSVAVTMAAFYNPAIAGVLGVLSQCTSIIGKIGVIFLGGSFSDAQKLDAIMNTLRRIYEKTDDHVISSVVVTLMMLVTSTLLYMEIRDYSFEIKKSKQYKEFVKWGGSSAVLGTVVFFGVDDLVMRKMMILPVVYLKYATTPAVIMVIEIAKAYILGNTIKAMLSGFILAYQKVGDRLENNINAVPDNNIQANNLSERTYRYLGLNKLVKELIN